MRLLLGAVVVMLAALAVESCAGLAPPPVEQDAADLCRYCAAHAYRSAAGCFGVRPGCLGQPD